jgi:hypothetical protein
MEGEIAVDSPIVTSGCQNASLRESPAAVWLTLTAIYVIALAILIFRRRRKAATPLR